MRRLTLPAAVLLLLAAGCATPKAAPADRLAQSEAAYTATASTLLELRRAGKVSDDDWKIIKELNEAADESFEAAHLMIDSGDPAGVDDVLDGTRAMTRRLETYKAEARRAD